LEGNRRVNDNSQFINQIGVCENHKWLAERNAELLPVEYFHVVFTLPQQVARLALQNARRIYSILFRAVAETLLTIAADPQHLSAAIGFLAVLHSWGQTLHLHPISIA
jgi:hypothetical protein